MIGCRRRGAIDGDDVHPRQHLVKAIPIGCLKLRLGGRIDALAVMIMNGKPEGLGAACNRRSDAAHANNTDALAGNTPPQHPSR
ncbi:hypothetical protein D3C78_1342160 [compost metagenome]